MLFKKAGRPAEPSLEAPQPDQSLRRQGSIEALNLIAQTVRDAVAAARRDVEPGGTDNFVAGQMMAFGQVLAGIERERETLLQQLVREAGLSQTAETPGWSAEMTLLQQTELTSEDLFRLAMDYRQVELPAEEIELLAEGAPIEGPVDVPVAAVASEPPALSEPAPSEPPPPGDVEDTPAP